MFSLTCQECLEKKRRAFASKKNKENQPDEEVSDKEDAEIDDIADFFNMSVVNLDAFLDALSASETEVKTISALTSQTSYLRKCAATSETQESTHSTGAPSAGMVAPPPEIIDLSMSSPPPASPAQNLRSSSPIEYGTDDEEEIDGYSQHLLARAEAFRRAADIFESQASSSTHDGRIWMKSVVERDVGRDVDHLVQDVRRFEETGRTRGNTWANPKSKEEVRRMKNTMGYQVRRRV
ncbi:hypothetical protein BDZ97DRAFT_1924115 [Flammula alnicola]|nr:hypothetical protein BDZ97DRAFT_1924115 [Flammula alnicola]